MSEQTPSITLEPIPHAARATLDNLFQLYIHDFSELWAGMDRAELGEDGLYALDGSLDAYWTDARAAPYFIRAGRALAGFVLVNATSHQGCDVDFNVGEFFVVRKHRRQGVGRRAAIALFEQGRGVWEAAVVEKNIGAIKFWRDTIASCGVARDVEEIAGDGVLWRGPIFRFRT